MNTLPRAVRQGGMQASVERKNEARQELNFCFIEPRLSPGQCGPLRVRRCVGWVDERVRVSMCASVAAQAALAPESWPFGHVRFMFSARLAAREKPSASERSVYIAHHPNRPVGAARRPVVAPKRQRDGAACYALQLGRADSSLAHIFLLQ